MAGAKALAEAGVDPAEVGLLDRHLGEPRAPRAVRGRAVHHALGLPTHLPQLRRRQRLPRLPQRHAAGRDDDRRGPDRLRARRGRRGRARRSTRTPSTGSPRRTRPARTSWRSSPRSRSAPARRRWCSGRADRHPEGHRLVGGVTRAATEHHELCVGGLEAMQTDTKGLLDAGHGALRRRCGATRRREFDWSTWTATSCTRSPRCTPRAMCRTAGHRPDAGAADVPDPRQHGPGLDPVHARHQARHAADRRPGAAHGRRLRPQRLPASRWSGDGRVRTAAARPPAGLPGLDPAWSRLVRPDADGRGAPGTCSTTAARRLDPVGTLLCVHGNPTWSYLWRRFVAAAPRPAGGWSPSTSSGWGSPSGSRRARSRSPSGSPTSAP